MMLRRKPSSSAEWAGFLVLHASLGAGLGVLVGAGMLVTNVFDVGTLFLQSDAPIAASALYFLSFASMFAAGSTATAVMGLARRDR
jgi:hypothetical protein